MAEYIFLTTEGSTFQPSSISSEPDVENMQVIGFARGDTVQDAATRLVELNKYLVDTSFDDIFAIQIADENREYLSLRGLIQRYTRSQAD
ncbi:MAG: hypothetical protein PHY18_06005 [Dehalococcoidales bacterium]|nr:hypothetical protein [Dehalococcoidales bacterium]